MDSFFATYFPIVKDASGRESGVLRVFHAVYFVLLTILISSQVVSKFMMSGMQILLSVNWLLELIAILLLRRKNSQKPSAKEPTSLCGREFPLLLAFLVMMAVHVVWLIGTSNMAYGLDDLFRKLPLLAIPVVVLTSRPLNRKQITWLLFCYVGTVFVTTIIGVVRLLTIPDLPYRDIVPFISHIRFSLNICVAIVLLIWSYTTTLQRSSTSTTLHQYISTPLHLLLIFWFAAFLFILRSYTAFIVLFVTAWLMLLIYWRRLKGATGGCGLRYIPRRRLWFLAGMFALTLAVALMSNHYVRSYYGDYSPTSLHQSSITTGLVENGHLLGDAVSSAELEQQWPMRSSMQIYDTTPNGFTVYPTLVRYLNASGLTKDSAGLAQLSDRDIMLIEKGVANPIYADGPTVKKMVYTLLFEYENYRVYGNIRNSSLLERFELWRGAWRVFCDNPLFGVGTGDGVDQLHQRLQSDGSQIADTVKHAHNQYLSFLISFGLVGFLLIAITFVYAFRRIGLRRNPAFFAIIVILLISFISEDTLETLAGSVLCTLIPCLLARNISLSTDYQHSTLN